MPEIGEIKCGGEINKNLRHKFIWSACASCSKERWVKLNHMKPLHLHCNNCSYKYNKGGFKTKDGYRMVHLLPDDFFYSMADKKGYVYEHRLVIAKHLGRCLQSWEIVHHKGTKYPKGSIENRQDNRYPENLQLVSDDRHKQITILENIIRRLKDKIKTLESDHKRTLIPLKVKLPENPYKSCDCGNSYCEFLTKMKREATTWDEALKQSKESLLKQGIEVQE